MIAEYLTRLRLFNRDVRLLLVVYSIMGFGYVGLYAVLFNLYLLRLGYDPEFIGQVNAVGRLGFGLAGIPAGLLGLRFGTRRLMLAGESIIIVGLVGAPCVEFLPAFVHTPWLFACCALAFSGATVFFVNSSPHVMSVTADVERRHAFSLLGAVVPLAAFLGSLAGGVLPGFFASLLDLGDAHPAPYRYALIIAGCLFVLTIPLVLATRRPPPRSPGATVTDEKAPLLVIATLSVVGLLASTGMGSTGAFFNVYLDDGLGIATQWIGSITAISQLIAVPAVAFMPLLAARFGNRRTYLITQCGVALALLPLGLIPHFAAAGAGLVCVAAGSAIAGAIFNLYSQSSVDQRWRALMSGSTFTCMGCSWALTAFLGGYAIEHIGYHALFVGAAATTAAGAVAFALSSKVGIAARLVRKATVARVAAR